MSAQNGVTADTSRSSLKRTSEATKTPHPKVARKLLTELELENANCIEEDALHPKPKKKAVMDMARKLITELESENPNCIEEDHPKPKEKAGMDIDERKEQAI